MMQKHTDGIVLFSGGLDSLLTARVLSDQGLSIRCVHFISPFYGVPYGAGRWKKLYGVDVDVIDAGEEMSALVTGWPQHGFGKVMNPCVDCKILQMRLAKKLMDELGASFIATGEVLGQRPMSQRRDVMNTIRREAGVEGLLLRPLSALHLDPTPMELSGLVDRSRLLGIHGRGRQDQLAMAEEYGWTEIPSPGGGCLLTERENARRFWPVRTRRENADASDYRLAGVGRQAWLLDAEQPRWMSVARNSRDNEELRSFQRPGDLLCGTCDFPGPLSLLRDGALWDNDSRLLAAAAAASYSPKAVRSGGPVRIWMKEADGRQSVVTVTPDVERSHFRSMTWEEMRAEKHALASERAAVENREREERKAQTRLRRAERDRLRAEEAAAVPSPPESCACCAGEGQSIVPDRDEA